MAHLNDVKRQVSGCLMLRHIGRQLPLSITSRKQFNKAPCKLTVEFIEIMERSFHNFEEHNGTPCRI